MNGGKKKKALRDSKCAAEQYGAENSDRWADFNLSKPSEIKP